MSPTFATRLATLLFGHRLWFLAVSLLGMALLFLTLTYGTPGAAAAASALAGLLIFVPWALLCTCLWLHPVHGSLQPGSKFVGRLPDVVQRIVRWYASLMLGVLVFVGLVVWPALSLAWL